MNAPTSFREGSPSLLCLYYPHQLLPGLAAVVGFRRHQGKDATLPLTVLVWNHPAIGLEVRERRLQTFKVLLEDFSWVTLVYPDQDEIRSHLSSYTKVMRKADYFQKKFGSNSFAAIYYAHDISADFIAQSAMQAFPDAARVCFGDALGVVYSNDFFTTQTYPLNVAGICKRPINGIINTLARLKRAWTLPSRARRLDADYAALILPCDPGGDFLAGKVLIPIDHAAVRRVLDNLSRAVERHWTKDKSSGNREIDAPVVMLLGSYAESRLTSENQECAMYVEVAREHIMPGTKIILKAHPASTKEKVAHINLALSKYYDIAGICNDEFPIETLPSLAKYRVISFSYSSVSLLYIYGSAVLHAMNDALIDRFFPEETRRWLRESNQLYLDQLAVAARLQTLTSGR